MIEIENLTVIYRDIPAIYNINVQFQKGNLIAIVGPNGAGKSTLAKSILNLTNISQGSIKINGISHDKIKNKHKLLAYVPQRETVNWDFPINSLDVTMMGLYGHIGWFKRPGKKHRDLAIEALRKFGLEDYANHQIGELSGGQKQRVFLARAYLQNANIYVLDEPFGGIDANTEIQTIKLFKELKKQGKTIIVITHDLQSLKPHFDHVLLLNRVKIAYGTPKEVFNSKNLKDAYGGHLHMVYSDDQNI